MSKAATPDDSGDNAINQWRIKKLIQSLEKARGAGTSMISLIIPPKDQISRYAKMLADELGTATNIKNRVNRLSVLSAITSAQQKLKLYNKVPDNGLVLYCGTIVQEDGKEKKVSIDIEPHKPINTSLYLCDNKFHTEPLNELLESDDKFGFIVIDGSGCLYGTVSGNTRTVLHRMTVELPKKHGRGGQSALRFARLRLEKRHNYVRKCAELATQFFITNDRPNITGLVLAGLADFKNDLAQSDMFDQRLQRIIIKIVDVSYGGDNGFNQAIELAGEALRNVKFIQEKKLIGKFFEEIATDSNKYCFGIRDTMHALNSGAVETLIVYEDLEMNRIVVRNPETKEEKVMFVTPEQEKQENFLKQDGVQLEVVEKDPVVEWFALNYKQWGANLQFVTNKSQEGAQFVKGFGGIGCLLRYQIDFNSLEDDFNAADGADIEVDEDFDFEY